MFCNKRVVIVCFLIVQQISFAITKTITISNGEQVKAAQKLNDVEHKSPTTSYYRHNLFGPNTYAFGFEVNDKATGNIQFRDERRYANGSVEGSYGYVRPDGSVMVTHFVANNESGYLSQTQNFEPGDEPKWQENWPTKRPSILMEKPNELQKPTVNYDEKEKLNLTSILLPVEPINEEHGIDLNPPTLEKELVNPAVLEVINGETPLIKQNGKKDDTIGFETINKFLPPDFPIIPFELPPEEPNKTKEQTDVAKNNDKTETSAKTNKTDPSFKKYNSQKLNNSEKEINLPDSSATPADKYVKSKENNAEKSLPMETLRTSSSPTTTDKYVKSKENNAEKSLPAETLKTSLNKNEDKTLTKENNAEKSLPSEALSTSINKNDEKTLNEESISEKFLSSDISPNNVNDNENLQKLPKAKSLDLNDNLAWYDKVIKQTRQEYLENLN